MIVVETSTGPPGTRAGTESMGLCPIIACPDWPDRVAGALSEALGGRPSTLALSEIPMVHVYAAPAPASVVMTTHSAASGRSLTVYLSRDAAQSLVSDLLAVGPEARAYYEALGRSESPRETIGIPMGTDSPRTDPAATAALERLSNR